MVKQAGDNTVPAAELGGSAFAAQQFLDDLSFELETETPPVGHGKVLSAPIIGHRPRQTFLTQCVQLQGFTPLRITDSS